MATHSPSPIQAIGVPSPTVETPRDSRSSSSYQDPPGGPLSLSSSRTGLVSSFTANGQRSYGTVKQSFRRSSVLVITHYPVEGETLQGLALRYNVPVRVEPASQLAKQL